MPILPEDPRVQRCGFAKLAGDHGNLDYVIRKYEVSLGRPSKAKSVDVQMATKAVSREHASIRYNFDTKVFELHVTGKNGVRVNGVEHKPAGDELPPPVPLASGMMLQIGEDLTFYFLLPKSPREVVTGRKRKPLSALPPHMATLKRTATATSRPASAALKPAVAPASAAAPPAAVLQMFMQPQPVAAAQTAAPAPTQAGATATVQQLHEAAQPVQQPLQQQQAPVAAQPGQANVSPSMLAQAQQQLLASLIQNPAALQQMLAMSLQQQRSGQPGAGLPAGLPPAVLAALQQQAAMQQAGGVLPAAAMAQQAALLQQQQQMALQQQQQQQLAMQQQQQQMAMQQQQAAQRAAAASAAPKPKPAVPLGHQLSALLSMPPEQQQIVLANLNAQQRQAAMVLLSNHRMQQQGGGH